MAQPSVPVLLWRGFTRACPVCGRRRGLFHGWSHMAEICPGCGLRFERQAGHFIGGVTINTVVTFVLGFVVMMSWIALTWPDLSFAVGLAALLPVGTVFPVLFYPVSKTLWTAIDLAMRPLKPDEVVSAPD